MSAAKPSNPDNPKDRIAGTKLPSGLCPDTAIVHLSLAFLEGALKYGRYNWRIAGVSASVYNDALKRHRKKWWNGQDRDPITKVHHLANLMACAAIMLDAELYGMLNDDRPPCPNPDAMADLIDKQSELVIHLKNLFKDHNPRQYKIGDTRESVAAEAAATAENDRQAEELLGRLAATFVAEMMAEDGPMVVFEDGPEMRGNDCGEVMEDATPGEDPAPPVESLAELVGDARGEMADAADALAEAVHVEMAPEPQALPVYCDTPLCYGSHGHAGPHSDYEGVNFPSAV